MIHYNPELHKEIILQTLRKKSYEDNKLAIAGNTSVFLNTGSEYYCVPGPIAFMLNMEAHNIERNDRGSASSPIHWCK